MTFHENRHLPLARVILRHSPFDGGTPCPLPRGDLPPHVFLPRSRSSDPTGRGRSGTPRKQQHNNDTMMSCRGSRAIIAPREVRLILSGIPLSLTIVGNKKTEFSKFSEIFEDVFLQKLIFREGLASSGVENPIRLDALHILAYGELRRS